MKKIFWSLAILVLFANELFAVGSTVVTETRLPGNAYKYTIVWTSDGSGNVNVQTFATFGRGRLYQVELTPGTSTLQPTNLYDVTLKTPAGTDILATLGTDLSNVNGKLVYTNFYYDGLAPLDITVAAAGAAKSGTFTLWIAE